MDYEYSSNDTFTIMDVDGFCEEVVKFVNLNMGNKEENFQELFQFVTTKQVLDCVINNSVGADEDGRLIISSESFISIVNEVTKYVCGTMLAKLASEGYLECYWDEQENDMMFMRAEN